MRPLHLPAPDGDWLNHVRSSVEVNLRLTRDLLDRLRDGTARSSGEVLELWNDADIALHNANSLAGLLSEVHPDAAVRAGAEECAQEISRVRTERGLDRGLYDVLAATDELGLDADAARFRSRVLRDFRRAGVDRPDDVRARLRAIAERVTVLDQDFARNIRDDVRSIRVAPDRLGGLPADFVAAHPAGADGLVELSTDTPDFVPIRLFATDGGVRRDLTRQYLDRAWPANDAVLAEILELRAELAGLVGYDDWPSYDADVKMIGSGKAIIEFVDRITAAAEEGGRRDYDVVLARAQRDDPARTSLDRADFSYYEQLVRREDYSVDTQQVRRYFDFVEVRAGLLDVTARLFGVDYRPVPDAGSWHEDVAVYDVVVDGQHHGRIHLDLHPREGKFKHAAQFDLAVGIEGRLLPEGALVCNLPRGLMEHSDVVTLFHEFGHLVHHVLGGRQHWARFSGVATEWDFVEAPSQLLEEWAWDTAVLQSFAVDADGAPIPADLVERMRAAKEFGKGCFTRTQMFYAALSYRLHQDRPADLTATVRDLQARYDLIDHLPGTHFHASFGHLTGYGSGYYTYMWSLVIAKDLFSAFDRTDLFDAAVVQRYRDEILARGGCADAADLVEAFLGRPYSFDAFQAWLDVAPMAR